MLGPASSPDQQWKLAATKTTAYEELIILNREKRIKILPHFGRAGAKNEKGSTSLEGLESHQLFCFFVISLTTGKKKQGIRAGREMILLKNEYC